MSKHIILGLIKPLKFKFSSQNLKVDFHPFNKLNFELERLQLVCKLECSQFYLKNYELPEDFGSY